MREIKFRAWDSSRMRMGKALRVSFVDEGAWAAEIDFGDNDSKTAFGNGLTLMQFTGLRDKNGKEIYEGDIVCDSEGGIHEVKYYTELYWDGGGSGHPGFYLSGGFDRYGIDDFYMSPRTGFGGCEIIGNVHESPDLLPDNIPKRIPKTAFVSGR